MKPKRRKEYKFMARQRSALSYKQMAVFKPHYKVIFYLRCMGFQD
jgi:hypothetical protein